MTWRARFRARQRRRALSRLLPGHPFDGDNDVILVAVPVPATALLDEVGRVDFHKRAEVCNYVGRRAAIQASQLVKDRYPVKFPDQMGTKFKEGWKGLAAY